MYRGLNLVYRVLDHMKPFCSGLSITSSNIDDCARMKMEDISLSGTIQIKLVISYTSKWKDMYSLCNEIRIINFLNFNKIVPYLY